MSSSAFRHHRHLPRKSAVALLTLGIVTALATPALAWHPDLTGDVACAANGQQVVTWSVTNSETVDGANSTMTVDQVSVSSGTVAPLAVGTVFPPQPEAGSTQTSTTELPGTQTGDVTLTVRADWEGADQDVERSVSVTLPGTCLAPVVTTTTTTAAPTTTTTQTTTTTTVAPLTLAAVPTTTTTTLAPQVLGEVLVAPEAPAPAAVLPKTGSPIGSTVLLGAVALALGLMINRFARAKKAA